MRQKNALKAGRNPTQRNLVMNPYHQMLEKPQSSKYYDQFLKSAIPLKDHFGINHFWYYRITFSGHYSYIGTHTKWDEFCFGNEGTSEMKERIRGLRTTGGIQLFQASKLKNKALRNAFEAAWQKFKIRFSFSWCKSSLIGVEGYGFATYFNDPLVDERLLNQLPLLQYFAQNFQAKNRKIFELVNNYQVDLLSLYGIDFMASPEEIQLPCNKPQLLHKLGLGPVLKLKVRERDILSFVRSGFPAAYIAKKLQMSERTVENYMVSLKEKLGCSSKVQLIHKAQEIDSMGYWGDRAENIFKN